MVASISKPLNPVTVARAALSKVKSCVIAIGRPYPFASPTTTPPANTADDVYGGKEVDEVPTCVSPFNTT